MERDKIQKPPPIVAIIRAVENRALSSGAAAAVAVNYAEGAISPRNRNFISKHPPALTKKVQCRLLNM